MAIEDGYYQGGEFDLATKNTPGSNTDIFKKRLPLPSAENYSYADNFRNKLVADNGILPTQQYNASDIGFNTEDIIKPPGTELSAFDKFNIFSRALGGVGDLLGGIGSLQQVGVAKDALEETKVLNRENIFNQQLNQFKQGAAFDNRTRAQQRFITGTQANKDISHLKLLNIADPRAS
jgi:hypothetical protein